MMTATHTYRCGHPASGPSPLGGNWLYDCDACQAVKVAEGKARTGWAAGPVYTVIGEHGNSDGPYTRELPSLAAALEAIRADNLPLAPISADGGLANSGNRVSFTVSRTLCYVIIEHSPQTGTDPVTGWRFGGYQEDGRRVYDLTRGTVVIAGKSPVAVPDDQLSAEWMAYRWKLAKAKELPKYRDNSSGCYRDALGCT